MKRFLLAAMIFAAAMVPAQADQLSAAKDLAAACTADINEADVPMKNATYDCGAAMRAFEKLAEAEKNLPKMVHYTAIGISLEAVYGALLYDSGNKAVALDAWKDAFLAAQAIIDLAASSKGIVSPDDLAQAHKVQSAITYAVTDAKGQNS